jgi:hypothetical protein
VLGETVARPATVDGQCLDHVGGDEREEHVGGGLNGPAAGEPALVVETPRQAAAVRELLGDDAPAVRGGIGVVAPDALKRAIDGEDARVIAREVRRPSVERGDRVRRVPDRLKRSGQTLDAGDVVEEDEVGSPGRSLRFYSRGGANGSSTGRRRCS